MSDVSTFNDRLPPGARPKPVAWWGPRCTVCGMYFNEAGWDDRHDDHLANPIHAHCCKGCDLDE